MLNIKTSLFYFVFFYAMAFHPNCFPVSLEECDTSKAIEAIHNSLIKINDYQMEALVSFGEKKITSSIQGKRPNLLKISMKIPEEQSSLSLLTIFDGSFQWIAQEFQKTTKVSRIKLDSIVSKDRPFDTSYYLMGSGLVNGEDYLGTINTLLQVYRLTAKCENGTIELAGPLKVSAFKEYMKSKKSSGSIESTVKQFSESFNYAKLIFDDRQLILSAYLLGNKNTKNDEIDDFSVEFRKMRFNQELSSSLFVFKAPKDVSVVDITADIIKHLKETN